MNIHLDRKILKAVSFGIIIALLWVAAVRFATFKSDSVHHHANFALYINGQRDEFKNFTFYEEVAACSTHERDNVKARVHMHDSNNHLIHVHANAVTWSQFFTNLRYSLGDNLIATDQGVYAAGQDDNDLTFILNGQPINSLAGRLIKSQDVLLINYGKDNLETLQKRYNDIPHSASEANTKPDPASCSGSSGPSFTDRLKYSIGLEPAKH